MGPVRRHGRGGRRAARAGLADADRRAWRPLPDQQDDGVRGGDRRAGLHAGHAARVRRRPHRGDRQHDPQAGQRGQAAAFRRVLLLPGPLQRRVRPGGAAELRHPGPGRPGQERQLRAAHHHQRGRDCVVGVFLFLIAAFNLVVLAGIIRVFREMRGGAYDDAELEEQLNKRGLMNRFLGPLARRVDTPWKIYPIGFLFGLGFDTATEIALLVLAGTAVAGGLPFYVILSLPILFAAGMSLFDTADGCFMNFAYDWAFAKPVRKVYYNLTITGLSVFVAGFIGAVELLGLLAQNANLSGSFWVFLANFNINTAGFFIVAVFVVTWVVALAIWRFGRIEQKWETAPADSPD